MSISELITETPKDLKKKKTRKKKDEVREEEVQEKESEELIPPLQTTEKKKKKKKKPIESEIQEYQQHLENQEQVCDCVNLNLSITLHIYVA